MPTRSSIRQFIYTAGISVYREPYTHRLVGSVLAAAANRGYAVRLRVPDSPEILEKTLLMQLIRHNGKHIPYNGIEISSKNVPSFRSESVLFFAGSMDYWRLAARAPRFANHCLKVFWFQGFESEESFMKHRGMIRRRILALSESIAMKMCRVIICPSDAMVEALVERYSFLNSKCFITIPNLACDMPVPSRDPSLWGFEKAPYLALGYLGGLSDWQCFEETCRITAEIENRLPDAWFLVLTRNKDQAEGILKRVGVKRYRIRTTTTDQAARYVTSFDLGFMLRRDHLLNRVACPMKWLEYWQCGVPLITTGAVRIVDEASAAGFNCKIDMNDFNNAAERIIARRSRSDNERQRERDELIRCVKRGWTWHHGSRAIEDIFDILNGTLEPDRYLWRDRFAQH